MTRILCTADLHIGAGADYAEDRLADQETVLKQIADVADERDVDLIVIAGDVFHRPRPNPSELHAFSRFVRRLDRLNIPTIAILGNAGHDQDGFGRPAALELFDARLFRVSRHPERITEFAGVTVCTLPSVPTSRMTAIEGGGDRSRIYEDAAGYLVDVAQALRSDVPDGMPCILVGHWSVSGAALPSGLPTDTLNEPVLPLGELEQLGFDAIVLGHIHKAQVIESAPFMSQTPTFYCGSPLVTNFGEAHCEHGVFLMELEPSHVLAPEFVSLTDRPFLTVDVDLVDSGALADDDEGNPSPLDETDLIAAEISSLAPMNGAVLRIRYRATEAQHRRVDQGSLKQLAIDCGAHRVFQVVPDVVRESRARAEGVDETLAPLDAVTAWTVMNNIPDEPAQNLETITVTFLERVAA